MDVARRISHIFAEAERQLNLLAVEALAQRNYEAASQIAAAAKRVSMPDEDASGMIKGDFPFPKVPIPEVAAPLLYEAKRGTKDGSKFPRFHRDGGYLVKTGVSRSDRRVYQHRCPREVLDRIASEIAQLTEGGGVFTTDQLMPAQSENLSDVPVYQVYLCLGFLLKQGVVRRKSRSDYVVSDIDGSTLPSVVRSYWDALKDT